MEPRERVSDSLKALMAKLGGSASREREEAFALLGFRYSKDDIDAVYSQLLGQGDTQSIYWLIRYLIQIEQPEGFVKWGRLLEDERPQVRLQARSGIKELAEKEKVRFLTTLLHSRYHDNVLFSAETFAEMTAPEALEALLEQVKENPDIVIRKACIRALSRIPDERVLKPLELLVQKEKGELQETALEALVRLGLGTELRFFKRYLSNENPTIRERAALALLRSTSARWENVIAEFLKSESSPQIKIHILSSVRSVQSRHFFRTLFDFAVSDPEPSVRMIAESTLKKTRSRISLDGLKEELRSDDESRKILAVRVLSVYRSAGRVPWWLKEKYLESDSERFRLAVLWAFEQLKNPKILPFLESLITGRSLEDRYPAAMAYAKIAGMKVWEDPPSFLVDPNVEGEVLTVFLRLFLEAPDRWRPPEGLRERIRAFGKHPYPPIRYLVLRASRFFQDQGMVESLLASIQTDPNRGVREAALKSLRTIVRNDPVRFSSLAAACYRSHILFRTARKLVRSISVEYETHFFLIVKSLLTLVRMSRGESSGKFQRLRLLVLMADLADREKALYFRILTRDDWDAEEMLDLAKILNHLELDDLEKIDVSFLAQPFREGSDALKHELLRFFKKGKTHQPAIEAALLDQLAKELSSQGRETIYGVFRDWIEAEKAKEAFLP